LNQYGAEPFEQQQFGTAGTEGIKSNKKLLPANSLITPTMPYINLTSASSGI